MVSQKKKVLGTALVLVVAASLLFLNPFDILTKKSDSFSLERFATIEVGQPIDVAIEQLGAPISVKDTASCDGCRLYFFMGEYPHWVFGGTECWYVVDVNNTIIERVVVCEP